MSAREAILGRVKAACGRDTSQPVSQGSIPLPGVMSWPDVIAQMPQEVQARITQPTRLTQPAQPQDLTETLIKKMEAVQMSVVRLQTRDDVVEAVNWYLQEHDIDGGLSVSPSLHALNWPADVHIGPATGTEATSVTTAMNGVAETGSIALDSGPDSPSTLNFLPENHIVVLHESQIVAGLDDVWAQMRKLSTLPRAVNLVTGPSRTGDIEQTIELGAHGPRRMHVLLVASDHE